MGNPFPNWSLGTRKGSRLARPTDLQITGAGFEKAAPTFLRLRRGFFVQGLQIGQVRQTKGAGDAVQVEFNVILEGGIKSLQQIAAELVARGTAQALPAPDGADGVFAAVALLHEGA